MQTEITVKRVVKDHRYYDRVTVKDSTGSKTYYRLWKRRAEGREAYYTKAYARTTTGGGVVKRTPPASRLRYASSIRLALVVSYRRGTPFNFPPRGGTTTYYRPVLASEDDMIRALLGLDSEAAYSELKGWIKRFDYDRQVRIYGGWTYTLYTIDKKDNTVLRADKRQIIYEGRRYERRRSSR